MVKKLVSAVIGAGLVLATFAPAAFAVNLCANQTTGPSSSNDCHRVVTKMKTLTINNTGTVTHNLHSVSNSGNNTTDNNTSGGTVGAGAASSLVFKQASLNTGNVTVSQTDPANDEQGLNDTTGPSSTNNVTFTTTKTLTFTLGNSGTINQTVNSTANSGGNSASSNTIGGMVTTGNASSDVTVISAMNDFNIELSQ